MANECAQCGDRLDHDACDLPCGISVCSDCWELYYGDCAGCSGYDPHCTFSDPRKVIDG